MGKEALITINCERYSERITDIINLFDQSGWKFYDDEKKLSTCLQVKLILIGKKIFFRQKNYKRLLKKNKRKMNQQVWLCIMKILMRE